MSDATTVLFGLPGVRVERVERRANGTRVVDVTTDEPTAAACPSCGVVSISVKEYVVTSPKDIPYGDGRIVVCWNKVRWRCREDHWASGCYKETLCICGPSGTGQSHFCEALGQAAVEEGLTVARFTIEDLGALTRRRRVDDSVARENPRCPPRSHRCR